MEYIEPHTEVTLPKKSDRATIIDVEIMGGKVTIAVASRSQLRNVPKRINQTGAYILLSYIDKQSHEYSVYVGISRMDSNGIVNRVKIHKADKDKSWWERAIFIPSGSDLTTSIFVELEHLLIQELKTYKSAIPTNKNKGSKQKLGKGEAKSVEQIQGIARAIFWMLGYGTKIAEEKQDTPGRKKRSSSSSSNKLPNSARATKLSHLFDAGELQLGDRLIIASKKYNPIIKVVDGGYLEVKGVLGKFETPLNAFQEYRRSLGERTPGRFGGAWSSWKVKHTDGKSENLLKIRARYCKNNNIPG